MKHWPTWRCAECLNIYCSLGEIASDIGARPISGEFLYSQLFHTRCSDTVEVIYCYITCARLLIPPQPFSACETSVLT